MKVFWGSVSYSLFSGVFMLISNNASPHQTGWWSDIRLVVHFLLTTRLDFSNSILIGLPQQLIDKMQKVQNWAACLILNKRKTEHVTPLLKQLHWLPIRERIQYKIIYLTFKSLKGQSPQYLVDMLKSYTPVRELRSSRRNLLKFRMWNIRWWREHSLLLVQYYRTLSLMNYGR